MKTNWILFILVVLVTYGWMLSRQAQKDQEFREKMAQHEIDLAAWEARQANLEEIRQQAREAAARAAAGDTVTTPTRRVERTDTTTDSPVDPTGTEVSDLPPAASGEITDFERMLGMETARVHKIDTKLYTVQITEWGARPTSWEIKDSQFVRSTTNGSETTATLQLIPQTGDRALREYPLEFAGRTVNRFNNIMYEATRNELPDGTRLSFQSRSIDGMTVVKDYFFRHDNYVVDLSVTLINGEQAHKPLGDSETGFGIGWQGGFGEPEVSSRLTGWTQSVYSSMGTIRNRSVTRDSGPVRVVAPMEWVGMEKKYFAAIVMPSEANPSTAVEVYFNAFRNDANEYRVPGVNLPMSVALYHAPTRLDIGQTMSMDYQVYVGPKNRQALSSEAIVTAGMENPPHSLVFHTVPLGMGWLRPLCLVLLNLMRWLFEMIGHWGLAIIATTLIVRTIIYPLTHWAIKNQARTMIEQQKIRPEMEAITKKYKGDPAKRNQAVMQLYRDHNVNPLGFLRGCLPMLLQMPVFLALYVVFEQSVELRGQSFLWIADLSAPDALYTWGVNVPILGPSLNLLPILMAVTNYALMKIMQTPTTDELQAKIQKQMMIMMPIFLVLFLYQLPSGLILYWTVSNCISVGQSYFTKRIIAKHMAEHDEMKKNGLVVDGNKKELEGKPVGT
ncbi:MAG: membrane protein insertase YidC [Candidatus Sumerlaeia bacterium]|nr:membrane protein insertase YidC [Candidatus Sumerlaeia bacterium]